MNEFDILARTVAVIHDDLRHPDYARTLAVAEKAYQYSSGDGLECRLKRIVQHETEEEFNNRKQLMRLIAPTVVKRISDIHLKIPRANYRERLEADGDNAEQRMQRIGDAAKWFAGDFGSLSAYVRQRYMELNQTDPNTWIVTELAPFRPGEVAQPYPFEVSSERAIDFAYFQFTLQFLTVATPKVVMYRNEKKVWHDYTIYGQNKTVQLVQIMPEALPAGVVQFSAEEAPNTSLLWDSATNTPIRDGLLFSKSRVWLYKEFTPHNLGFVPAMRVGFARDLETNGRVYLPYFAAAYPLLEKSLKLDSELDVSVAASVFPKRAEYAPQCDEDGCFHGKHQATGETCRTCNGTGFKFATSAAHITRIPLPNDPLQIFNLDSLTSYKAPPTDLLAWMQERIDYLGAKAVETVMNSDIFSRSEIAETATGKNIQLQNAYDYLYSVAQSYALFWQHLMYTVNGFLGYTEDGLTAELIFPRDFKMEALADLFADMEAANRAGAGPSERIALSRRIVEHLHIDEPGRVAEWEKMQVLNPFAGYSEAQISAALASDVVPRSTKTLYLNYNDIVMRLKRQYAAAGIAFAQVADEMIITDAEALVNEIMEQTESARPALNIGMAGQ